MTTYIGVGESSIVDSFEAGCQSAKLALDNAGVTNCDFAFLFTSVGYNLENLLCGIKSVIGKTKLCGCSGTGVITGSGPIEELHCVAIMVVKSSEIIFQNAVFKNLKNNSHEAGLWISEALKEHITEKSILLAFPDSLSINSKPFFNGLHSGFGKFIPVVGGLSADNMSMRPDLNFQFFNNEILNNSISCCMISGDFSYEVGVSHGCVPLGLEMTVTSAKENRIYTINNIPSFDVLREYSDENLSDLNFELILHLCFGEKLLNSHYYDNYIIRTPLTLDKTDGSVTIPTEITTGSKISLMRRDPDRIIKKIDDIKTLFDQKRKGQQPIAVFHLNCAGRGKILLGRKAFEEFSLTKKIFDSPVPWIGFYGYGELAPLGNENYFHNYTSIVLALYKN